MAGALAMKPTQLNATNPLAARRALPLFLMISLSVDRVLDGGAITSDSQQVNNNASRLQ
jgi:hypothetical protein